MKEDIKTFVAAIGGMSVQFADIELALKILVGFLTAIYLTVRIIKLIRGKKDEE